MGDKVKEHPILFSGEMIKAILDGRKTMTRRVIHGPGLKNLEAVIKFEGKNCPLLDEFLKSCRYGQPGDRLWVKETFTHYGNCSEGSAPVYALIKYSADGITLHRGSWNDLDSAPKRDEWRDGRSKTIPSIFMPRWASRITLEIINVRVERLQEISEEDAKKEGCVNDVHLGHGGGTDSPIYRSGFNATEKFEELWDSINGKKYPWASNPWVWVISFKRVND